MGIKKPCCPINGATPGIGKAAALALAQKGNDLMIVGRNEGKTLRVTEEIKRKSHNKNVSYYICDLSELQDVRRLVDRIKGDGRRIDFLINDVGARFIKHQLTREGIE